MVDIYDWRQDGDGSFGVLPRNPSFEQVYDLFHIGVDTSKGADRATAGELYWQLKAFYLREGPATLMPIVWDQNRQGMASIVVFNHWPGAPQFPEPVKPDYHSAGVGGFTGSSGDIGWGLGDGSYIQDGQPGPHSIWCSANPGNEPPQWSDMATGIGMLGGTNHLMPHPIFELTRKGGTAPPPAEGDYKLAIVIGGQVQGWLTFDTGQSGDDYLALYGGQTEIGRLFWEPVQSMGRLTRWLRGR
jgi:hypothetical protein